MKTNETTNRAENAKYESVGLNYRSEMPMTLAELEAVVTHNSRLLKAARCSSYDTFYQSRATANGERRKEVAAFKAQIRELEAKIAELKDEVEYITGNCNQVIQDLHSQYRFEISETQLLQHDLHEWENAQRERIINTILNGNK